MLTVYLQAEASEPVPRQRRRKAAPERVPPMMSPIKSLYGRRTTAGIINIPSVSGCGFLPNSASSFLLPGLHFIILQCQCYQTLLARSNIATVVLHRLVCSNRWLTFMSGQSAASLCCRCRLSCHAQNFSSQLYNIYPVVMLAAFTCMPAQEPHGSCPPSWTCPPPPPPRTIRTGRGSAMHIVQTS